MPRKKNPPPVPAVAFTMATCTASYGNTQLDAPSNTLSNTQPNTQLHTQSNTPDPTLDPTFDPTLDPTLDPALDPAFNHTLNLDESRHQTIPPTKKKIGIVWTDMMEETLFNKLHRQDRLGKRANIGFKTEAWAVV